MTEMGKIPKEHLSLAGEYAAASELCRRGIYAQLTLGTRKRTDLLVDTESKMMRIQVKSKNVRNWTFCGGAFGEGIILVFVDYQKKMLDERPDFYILTPDDWEKLVKNELKAKLSDGEVELDGENCPIYVNRPEKSSKGMDVLTSQIIKHKERWRKIETLCD